jgi:hypothetical protein
VDNPIEGHHEVAPSAQFRLPTATKLNVEHGALSSRMLAQTSRRHHVQQATDPRSVVCFVITVDAALQVPISHAGNNPKFG